MKNFASIIIIVARRLRHYVIFKVFLRFNDKTDQHISNSHKPRIRNNKIPFISSMLTIVMMPGCLPQLRALCSCCFSECLVAIATSCSGKRSGYYGNLGSLKAGTRHHGDFSVMGTPSLQPFLKTYWLTPVNDWPIVAKHANMTSSRGSINAAPATITSESELNAAWLNEQRARRSPWCLVPAFREPRLP